ncbi:deoxyribodipyrimidine photo-lyase [Acidicapsa acidisoli]|uniref:deoxyribodipyrimidine photo-lyase n=1 Tax=Acidicapsa acidisoli TaxID=1615681 RepID=UPI0021DFD041|nr:deoxyribodipyrimidine photo-lyase [Acidicapsa acidisoli]
MAGELPEVLAGIALDVGFAKRVTVRRGGEPRRDGRCVVYWLQRAQRAIDNPALEIAVACGNSLGLPVVAYFSVIPNYPNSNWRHYYFLQQGLHDVAEEMRKRGVGFVIRRPSDGDTLEAFLEEVGAAMVVGDENVCREPERWRSVLAKKLKIPFLTVDADVVVPSAVFEKSFVLLHHFRPKLHAQLPEFLKPIEKVDVSHEWNLKLRSYDLAADITLGFDKLDRSVGPVDAFVGGTKAALRRLKEFTDTQLKDYDETRNHPEICGTSQMSPYLHYGHISPLTIALAVRDVEARGKAGKEVCDKYLDELIGWRELAVLFCKYNPNYDNWECAEPWAKKTLTEHTGDKRPWSYSLAQLERAETHDELWNAAQREMVRDGWMHNYMRMYWAKKILEWSPDVATAFERAVILNDRYELDGRDPNGYAGIAWAIVGKHDRPWFDRPVFGLVRYMSGESTGKKFDSKRYIEQQRVGARSAL